MALLRLKRESGLTLELLSNIGDIQDDKKKIKELKAQYAACAQDLDKTRHLLSLQEEINLGYKTELAQITQKMKLLQNEYGMLILKQSSAWKNIHVLLISAETKSRYSSANSKTCQAHRQHSRRSPRHQSPHWLQVTTKFRYIFKALSWTQLLL